MVANERLWMLDLSAEYISFSHHVCHGKDPPDPRHIGRSNSGACRVSSVGTSQQKRRPSGNEISSACRRRRLSGTHISKIRRPARRVAFLPISLIAFDQSRTNFPDSISSPLTSAIQKSISSIGTSWLVESTNSGAYSRRQDCGSYSRISRC